MSELESIDLSDIVPVVNLIITYTPLIINLPANPPQYDIYIGNNGLANINILEKPGKYKG